MPNAAQREAVEADLLGLRVAAEDQDLHLRLILGLRGWGDDSGLRSVAAAAEALGPCDSGMRVVENSGVLIFFPMILVQLVPPAGKDQNRRDGTAAALAAARGHGDRGGIWYQRVLPAFLTMARHGGDRRRALVRIRDRVPSAVAGRCRREDVPVRALLFAAAAFAMLLVETPEARLGLPSLPAPPHFFRSSFFSRLPMSRAPIL